MLYRLVESFDYVSAKDKFSSNIFRINILEDVNKKLSFRVWVGRVYNLRPVEFDNFLDDDLTSQDMVPVDITGIVFSNEDYLEFYWDNVEDVLSFVCNNLDSFVMTLQ